MKPTKSTKPYHAITNESGEVVEVGAGDYCLMLGQGVIEFDSRKDRGLHPLVGAYQLQKSIVRMQAQVEAMKDTQAYDAKFTEAIRLVRLSKDRKYNPDLGEYPFIFVEAEETGRKPLEIAKAIVKKVTIEPDATLAKERQRIRLRERTNALIKKAGVKA